MPTNHRSTDYLARHWFSIALVAMVLLAWLWPAPVSVIKRHRILDILIGVIFLNSGLTLRARQVFAGLTDLKSFCAIQGLSFVVFPLLMAASARLLFTGAGADLDAGFGLLLAVPTTISSCVILTAIARGATAVALVSAVAGNLLGVVVSPWLLKLYVGIGAQLDAWAMIVKLAQMVLAPVIVGQLVRRVAPEFFSSLAKRLSIFNQCVILLIVYTAAAQAIPSLALAPLLLPKVAVYLALFHALILAVSFGAARLRGGDPALRPAIVFCGAQKTLAIGQALALAVAAQNGGDAGLLMLPMVVYHVLQLLIDSVLAQRMGRS